MTSDGETIAFYNKEAATYAKCYPEAGESARFKYFVDRIVTGGNVLDLGCGAGSAARAFLGLGFNVTAFDGSEGMLEQLRKVEGITTICSDFGELDFDAEFNAIWANFCLQHVPRGDLPDVLTRISKALRPEGWLLIGIHEGTETRRDKLGRLYCHHTETDLTKALQALDIQVRQVTFADSTGYDGTPFTGMAMVAQKLG